MGNYRTRSEEVRRALDWGRVAKWLLSPQFLLVFIVLAGSVPAWATIIPCPINPVGGTLTPIITNGGCTTTALFFSNFSVGTNGGETVNGVTLVNQLTNSHGDVVPNPLSPSVIDVFTSCPTCAGLTFFSAPPYTNNSTNQSFCDSNSGSQGFCIQGENLSSANTISYVVSALTPSGSIGQIILGATVEVHNSGSGVNSGATAVVFREYCPGSLTFSQDCAHYGVLQVGVFNAKFQTLSQVASVMFSPVSFAAVRDTVYLLVNNGEGGFADIQLFSIDTPEPATFGLMGLSLAGLGFLRYRRKA